jgi:hypothetical protein
MFETEDTMATIGMLSLHKTHGSSECEQTKGVPFSEHQVEYLPENCIVLFEGQETCKQLFLMVHHHEAHGLFAEVGGCNGSIVYEFLSQFVFRRIGENTVLFVFLIFSIQRRMHLTRFHQA